MLVYLLDMGAVEQTLVRQALRERLPIPDRIQNAPELMEGLNLYLQAYFELSSERPIAMDGTPGLIPFSSIVGYAQIFNFDEEQRDTLLHCIRQMDLVYLERIREQRGNHTH